MIQTFFQGNRRILTLALAGAALACFIPSAAFAAGKAQPAAQDQNQPAGRLIIVRSANLGSAVVKVEIDGNQTARINFGGSYDQPISAGQHVVTVTPEPNREHAQPNQTKLNVQPGQTYKFTAARSDVAIVLK